MPSVSRQRMFRDTLGLEHIPHAADGADQIWFTVGIQLLAQIADVNLNGVGLRLVVETPHLLEDDFLADDLLRVAGEELQQLVLAPRQLYLAPSPLHPPAGRMDRQVTDRDDVLRRGPPPQRRPHAGQQLVEREGLG